jgi:hypothetical protein
LVKIQYISINKTLKYILKGLEVYKSYQIMKITDVDKYFLERET